MNYWDPRSTKLALALLGAFIVLAGEGRAQSISSLQPSSTAAGGPTFNLVVNGQGFNSQSSVVWRYGSIGSIALPTQFTNGTTLVASVGASLIATPGSVAVAVTQAGSVSNTATFTILPPQGLSINACPSNGIQNTAYSDSLTTSGGDLTSAFIWTISQGTLPPGLNLISSGIVSGTPNTAGVSNFTLRVVNGANAATRECSLTVVAPSGGNLFITNLVPNAVVAGSAAFTMTINGTGYGNGAVVLFDSSSPAPIVLTPATQTPVKLTLQVPANLLSTAKTVQVQVRQPNLSATVFSNSVDFNVLAPVSITTACPLPNGTLNSAYSGTLTAAGGFAPYTWTITLGALPQGLTLAPDGKLSGTPTEAGVFDITLMASDNQRNTTTRACSLKVVGPMVVSRNTISLRARDDSQIVFDTDSITCPSRVTPCSVTATGGAQSPWLTYQLAGPQTPTLLLVRADARALNPGVYRDTISLNSPDVTNQQVNVDVVLTVDPLTGGSPIVIRPTSLLIPQPRNSIAAIRRVIEITRAGSGQVSYAATVQNISGGGWLSLSANSGNVSAGTPAKLIATIRPLAGMTPGAYRAAINVTSAVGNLSIPVVLMISSGLELIQTSQVGVTVTAVAGGPAPQPVPVRVLAGGTSGFFWEASSSTLSGGNWLTVDPPSDASRPGTPTLTNLKFDLTNLTPDLYFGEVRIISSSADNSPRLVSVVLRVLDPAVSPGYLPEPSGLVFTAAPGGSAPGRQDILVRNNSPAPVNIDFSIGGDSTIWSATASPRLVPSGATRRISVGANVAGKAAGVYRGALAIQAGNDPNVTIADLALVIATGQLPSAVSAPQAAGCIPTRLVPVSTGQPVGFSVPGGLPVPLEVIVVDDCGDRLITGLVTASFSSGAPAPVALVHLGNGRWSGTWQVAQTAAAAATITFAADDPDRGLTGTTQLTGSITANPGIPVLNEDGVVSAASLIRGNPLAPGSLFSAYGVDLADNNVPALTLPLPAVLGSTRLGVAGRDVPLLSAGPFQVNAMLPYDLTTNTSAQLSIRRGTRRSTYVEFPIATVQPSIFTLGQGGIGQGIIVDGIKLSPIADAAAPIARGGYIAIYSEGLGAVNQPVVAGEAVPFPPSPETLTPVTVTIGGEPALVLFSGLVAYQTGLYQVNAQVPLTVIPGNAVPVVITQAGQSSQTVTIAVK